MSKSKGSKKKDMKAEGAADETSPSAADGPPEAAAAEDKAAATPAPVSSIDNGELERMKDRLLRLQADFDNFRKRTVRERQDTQRRAQEDVLFELLPVLDHLELAIDAATSHDADLQFVAGFRMVADQMATTLERFGLQRVPTVGTRFDHNVHEAVQQVPSEEHAEDHVVHEVKAGYTVGDRLLRAAQVVVSSGASEGAAAGAPEQDGTER